MSIFMNSYFLKKSYPDLDLLWKNHDEHNVSQKIEET